MTFPFFGTEDEMIARTRDADALVISSSPGTRSAGAQKRLKTVVRTRVGYDAIERPRAPSWAWSVDEGQTAM